MLLASSAFPSTSATQVLCKHLEPLTLRLAEGKAGEKRSLPELRHKVGREPRGPTTVRRGVASNRRKASQRGASLPHRRTLPKACVRPPGPSRTHLAHSVTSFSWEGVALSGLTRGKTSRTGVTCA